MSTRPRSDRKNLSALSGSPPRLMTRAGKCSSASAYATSGTKNEACSECASMISRTRLPRTARTRILASMTSALPGIALLLARCPADTLVLLHQLLFTRAPGGDHLIQILRCCAHGLQFGFPAALLRGNV